MYKFLFLLCCTVSFYACFGSNYKIEDLYGKWDSKSLGFTFNEDGSCVVLIDGNQWPGQTKYRAVSIGNTLEFTVNGKVFLSNVTIKSLKEDILEVEMRNMFGSKEMTSETHRLQRVQ